MNEVVLREFKASDIDELVPMWRASFEAGVGIRDPHTLAEQRDYFWSEVAARHQVRVLQSSGLLLGFVAASRDTVAQLFVRVGHHRRGLGSGLLAWAQAQSEGRLWLYTFAQNANARAFYERHGFRATAHGFEPNWQLADVRYEWSRPAPADN